VPSAPSAPARRAIAESPTGRREYEAYESSETPRFTVPAGTEFVLAAQFGGRPDAIQISHSGANLVFKIQNRGGGNAFLWVATSTSFDTRIPGREEIWVRDTTGAGAQTVNMIGLWGSRSIETRRNNGGPGPSIVRPRNEAGPEQIDSRP
jgi:hypothetical protein